MENTKDNTDIKLYFYTINVIPKELKTGQVEEKKKKWQMSKNPLIKHVFNKPASNTDIGLLPTVKLNKSSPGWDTAHYSVI